MRLILSLTLLLASLFVRAQTCKAELIKAYFCETDSCAQAQFALAKKLIIDDTTRAYVDYYKFFYYVRVEKYDSADMYYFKAQKQLQKLNNWFLYDNTLEARINTLRDRTMYNKAVSELKGAIRLATKNKNVQYMASWNVELANVYHNMGLYKDGIEHGKRAVALLDTSTNYPLIIRANNMIAICFDDNDKPDSALYYHYKNVTIGLENTNERSASTTLNNIGNTYLKMGRLDSAQRYLEKSLVLAKKIRDNASLATVLSNLGDIYTRTSQMKLAKNALDSALYFAELDKAAPLEKRRDVYRTLYMYYEKMGDMANAFLYQGKYITYRDSMHNLEQIEQLKDLELKATTAQKDKEIAQGDLKVKNRNTWIGAIAGLLLLALAFVRQLYLKRQQVAQQAQLKLQEERLRISRDLHDNIGAELTYISSLIDQKTFGMKDPEEKREYERLSDSSRSAMAQLRETIWAIKTEEITIEKFATKLNELSRKYSEGLGVKLSIAQSGENYLLPPAKVINLFRVCQEAINNAVKYSGCSEIRIELNAENATLNLYIVDNGKGFDVATTKTGYGLQNMRERIEEIGGKYNLKSISSEGTSISVSLPQRD